MQEALPHSPNHERAFLSCVLNYPLVRGQDALDEFGECYPFFLPECNLVWEAVRRIDLCKISELTVSDYLGSRIDAMALREISKGASHDAQFSLHLKWVRGQYTKRQLIESLGKQVAALYDPNGGVDSVIEGVRKDIDGIALGVEHNISNAAAMAEDTLKMYLNDEVGFYTHLRKLDHQIAPVPKGSLIVLAGRPGFGKTTLYTSMMLHMAQQGIGSVLYSMEMPVWQITTRMVCALARKNSMPEIVKANITDMEQDFQRFAALPVHCKDTPGMELTQLVREIKAMHSANGVKWYGIDRINKVKVKDKGMKTHEKIDYICSELKNLAMEIGGVIVAVNQLNREDEKSGGGPKIYNLKGSGGLEEHADVVILVGGVRSGEDEVNLIKQGLPIETPISIPKVRHNCPGNIVVPFYKHQSLFANDIL